MIILITFIALLGICFLRGVLEDVVVEIGGGEQDTWPEIAP